MKQRITNRRQWTEEEDEFLRRIWPEEPSYKAVVKRIARDGPRPHPRTRHSVEQRSRRLGLPGKYLVQAPSRPFTPAEDDTIRRLWGTTPTPEIAAAVARSGRNGTQAVRRHGIDDLGLPAPYLGRSRIQVSPAVMRVVAGMRASGEKWPVIAEVSGYSVDVLRRNFAALEPGEIDPHRVAPPPVSPVAARPSGVHPRLARPSFFRNEPHIVEMLRVGRR